MPGAVNGQLSDDQDDVCDDQEEGEHSEVDILNKPPEAPMEIRSVQAFLWGSGRVITLCITNTACKNCSLEHSQIFLT